MIVHNLSPIAQVGDEYLLLGVAIFCVLMITLSALGYRAERQNRRRQALAAVATELQRRIAESPAPVPDFTVTQIRVAADTNLRRATARDSQKGTTHE